MNDIWEGVDIYQFSRPVAIRWTKRKAPTDIATTQQEGAQFYLPISAGDSLTVTSGRYDVALNRKISYSVQVYSSLYWIKPRSTMAIRARWEVKVLSSGISRTETSKGKLEYTWFFKRYRRGGKYKWMEIPVTGADILENIKMLSALRFD